MPKTIENYIVWIRLFSQTNNRSLKNSKSSKYKKYKIDQQIGYVAAIDNVIGKEKLINKAELFDPNYYVVVSILKPGTLLQLEFYIITIREDNYVDHIHRKTIQNGRGENAAYHLIDTEGLISNDSAASLPSINDLSPSVIIQPNYFSSIDKTVTPESTKKGPEPIYKGPEQLGQLGQLGQPNQKNNDCNEEKSKLLIELQSLTTEKNNILHDRQFLNQEIQRLQKILDECDEMNDQLNQEKLKDKTDSLSKYEQSYRISLNQQVQLLNELKNMKQELKNAYDEINRLKSNFIGQREREEEYVKTIEILKPLPTQNTNLLKRCNTEEQKNIDLTKKLTETFQNYENLEKLMGQCTSELNIIQNQNKQLNSELRTTKDELHSEQEEKRKTEILKNNVEQKLNMVQQNFNNNQRLCTEKMKEMVQLNESLNHDLEIYRTKDDERNQHIISLQNNLNILTKEYQKLQQFSSEKEKEINECKLEKQECEKDFVVRVETLKRSHENINKQLEQRKNIQTEYEIKLKGVAEDNKKLIEDNRKLFEDNTILQRDLNRINKDIELLKDEHKEDLEEQKLKYEKTILNMKKDFEMRKKSEGTSEN